MVHPVFSHARSLWFYIAGWVVYGVAQGLFLYYYGDLEAPAAVADSLVYNFTMALLGLSLWYPIFYRQKKEAATGVLIHTALAGMVLLGLWLGLSFLATRLIMAGDPLYLSLAQRIIPLRLLSGAFILLVITAMYHLFIFYRDLEAQKLKEETLKKQVKESELKALKAQLNPHFLFNSLNSISSLTITDPDGARVMLNQLSDFLRFSLQKSNADLIPLREELQNMNRYLEIEKVRFGERLICETNADTTSLSFRLPAMILQPIYENAIKHGLYESLEPVTIRTFCHTANGRLHVSIVNNFDAETITPRGEGVGLENVLQTLRNIYNEDQLILISRENNHFEVSLTIPQQQPNGDTAY